VRVEAEPRVILEEWLVAALFTMKLVERDHGAV
jgi:hypothetical protein